MLRDAFRCCLLEIEDRLARIIRVIPSGTVTRFAALFRVPAARVVHSFPVGGPLKTGGDVAVTTLAGLDLRGRGAIARCFDRLSLR